MTPPTAVISGHPFVRRVSRESVNANPDFGTRTTGLIMVALKLVESRMGLEADYDSFLAHTGLINKTLLMKPSVWNAVTVSRSKEI